MSKMKTLELNFPNYCIYPRCMINKGFVDKIKKDLYGIAISTIGGKRLYIEYRADNNKPKTRTATISVNTKYEGQTIDIALMSTNNPADVANLIAAIVPEYAGSGMSIRDADGFINLTRCDYGNTAPDTLEVVAVDIKVDDDIGIGFVNLLSCITQKVDVHYDKQPGTWIDYNRKNGAGPKIRKVEVSVNKDEIGTLTMHTLKVKDLAMIQEFVDAEVEFSQFMSGAVIRAIDNLMIDWDQKYDPYRYGAYDL